MRVPPGHVAEVIDEHRSILQALRTRDPDIAARAGRAHILSFKGSLLATPR